MDFWREFLFNNAVGLILTTVKNADSRAKFRRAFLKVVNSIRAAYPNDKDFNPQVED